MHQTRREFLVTAAVAGAAVSLSLKASPNVESVEPVLFDGRDDGPGKRTFDDLRERALTRDCHLFELEI